ncbi:PAS domain S-box-containing protein/diguanylate cyclase (GGDEF) domain-containing protein [Marinospirillum celere]|uniref:PAS domain S-box-containing protein/diguanylate cyclase (GGDEF) domain-containing protein n=1 Tax=Marinospirillum celere TaxID=1122252 RepID=A0A1I1JI09_9GAMM|nr:GGDEF domain-containing phosphodiesterase [Marinospirillum celere]SFC48259.1 PAS domain S-box-containing protein/diguanylate cyclase (GGDEF) domain-containing protein [Marinospirillum celere]
MHTINAPQLVEKILANTLESIMITDQKGRILKVNAAFTEITGYQETEALGKTPALLRSERHPVSFYESIWTEIEREGSWSGEVWNRRKTGEIYLQWLSINALENTTGETTHYVAISHDLSELRAREAEVEFLAFNDPLTRLGNRKLLMSRLDQALASCRDQGEVLGLMIIDVGRLRPINDHFGLTSGDEVIRLQAERLNQVVEASDTLVRLQADTFALLRHRQADAAAMSRLATTILDRLSEGLTLDDKSLLMRPSVGMAFFPQDALHKEGLMQAAEHAHLQAKNAGRQTYCFFDHRQHYQQQRKQLIEQDLSQVLGVQQEPGLQLYFQPKVCLASGRICGAEALLRWQHPTLGWVSPGEFIPIAEQSHLCVRLDRWVLSRVVEHLASWKARGLGLYQLAVNLSAHQLDQEDFAEWLDTRVQSAGLKASNLQLEITEGAMIRNGDAAVALLKDLQQRGYSISLDDFGTGYSSLSYLDSLPLNELKIDRSFLPRLRQDQRSIKLLRSIAQLAQGLGLEVVVEGVEDDHQVALLNQFGHIKVQGYYFYRPLPEEAFKKLLPGAKAKEELPLCH